MCPVTWKAPDAAAFWPHGTNLPLISRPAVTGCIAIQTYLWATTWIQLTMAGPSVPRIAIWPGLSGTRRLGAPRGLGTKCIPVQRSGDQVYPYPIAWEPGPGERRAMFDHWRRGDGRGQLLIGGARHSDTAFNCTDLGSGQAQRFTRPVIPISLVLTKLKSTLNTVCLLIFKHTKKACILNTTMN
jgi:hypothetical protein